jgi:hypothetical protein
MNNFKPIRFIQFLLPDGRMKPIFINRPEEITQKAYELEEFGYRFECEILRDGQTVSFTLSDPNEGLDLDIELALNGPEVPHAIDRLITRSHKDFMPPPFGDS